jgi:hypothetical protein
VYFNFETRKMPYLTDLIVLTMYIRTVLGQNCSAEAFNETADESYLNKKSVDCKKKKQKKTTY